MKPETEIHKWKEKKKKKENCYAGITVQELTATGEKNQRLFPQNYTFVLVSLVYRIIYLNLIAIYKY